MFSFRLFCRCALVAEVLSHSVFLCVGILQKTLAVHRSPCCGRLTADEAYRGLNVAASGFHVTRVPSLFHVFLSFLFRITRRSFL